MASQDSVGYPVSRLRFAPQLVHPINVVFRHESFIPGRAVPRGLAPRCWPPASFDWESPLHRPWTLAFSVALRFGVRESTLHTVPFHTRR